MGRSGIRGVGPRADQQPARSASADAGRARHGRPGRPGRRLRRPVVVDRRGKDSGLLATAVKKAGGGEPAVAKGGTLEIAADPNGQLAYVTNEAQAPRRAR